MIKVFQRQIPNRAPAELRTYKTCTDKEETRGKCHTFLFPLSPSGQSPEIDRKGGGSTVEGLSCHRTLKWTSSHVFTWIIYTALILPSPSLSLLFLHTTRNLHHIKLSSTSRPHLQESHMYCIIGTV